MSSCSTGKRSFERYGDALAALVDVDHRQGRERGSVYECPECEAWHTTKRLFTVAKSRGRGKRRRGVVHPKGA